MTIDFTGRVAVVTGATRGIGLAIAAAFLDAGAAGVTITGRNDERLAYAARELGGGERVLTVRASNDDPDGAAAVFAQTQARFGRYDALVNNAGTNPAYGPLVDVDLGAVEKTWAVNLRGPLVYTRAAWHGGMRRSGGAIVNMASIGGLAPMAGIGAYNVSKAGLIAMTRQLAAELAPDVRVNALAPGIVKTRLSAALYESDEAGVAASVPLARLGVPEDIAQATLFLCGEASSWITGATLVIDGGALLQSS